MKILTIFLILALLLPATVKAQDKGTWQGKWAEEAAYLRDRNDFPANHGQETKQTSPQSGIWQGKWAEESGFIMDHHDLIELELMFNPRPKATSNFVDNIAVVRTLYDAFSKGDIPAVKRAMAPAIEWNEAENFPYAEGDPYIGIDAVLEGVFARLEGDWEYWKLTDLQFNETTNGKVIVTGRCQAKYKENGELIDLQMAHHWELTSGKVTRFQRFADTKGIADAMNK